MLFETQVDPLGEPFASKKNPSFYLRQVLIPDGKGGRLVVMIGSKDLPLLAALKTGSKISIRPASDFYFAG